MVLAVSSRPLQLAAAAAAAVVVVDCMSGVVVLPMARVSQFTRGSGVTVELLA